MASETKTCPFCAEVIKAAAIKCKHCGEFLESTEPRGVVLPDVESETHPRPPQKRAANLLPRNLFSRKQRARARESYRLFWGDRSTGFRVAILIFGALLVGFGDEIDTLLLPSPTADADPTPSAPTPATGMVPPRTPDAPPARHTPGVLIPAEVYLARVDFGDRTMKPGDAWLEPYAYLLDSLEYLDCTETRAEIGRMVTRAMKLVEEDFGRNVTGLFVLEQLEDATGGSLQDLLRAQRLGVTEKMACSSVLATLIVMIGQGGS